jgi:DNA-binding LacI/PurR family transcriptional regulator
MSVTIKDVARKAGVSHTTVSMVIHNDKRITPDTKKKVLLAIDELKYHPNYLARGLVQGKTNTIAVMATFFSSFFEMNFLKGIEQEIGESEYQINEYSTRGKPGVKQLIMEQILYGKRADALISLSIKPEKEMLEEFRKSGLPIILIEEEMKGAHTIKTDNFKGGFIATEYLLQKSRKKIGIIVGEVNGDEVGTSPEDRLKGYKKALTEFNVEFDKDLVYEVKDFDYKDGKEALKKFLSSGKKIDAVFCAAGDYTAMGLLEEARKRFIKVPQDLSVIGYDDLEMSAIVNPPLTTVRQSITEMGREAYKIAVLAAEGKAKEPKNITLQPELIVRESA